MLYYWLVGVLLAIIVALSVGYVWPKQRPH